MPTTQEIAEFYRQNANNPDAIRAAMAQYGVTPEQAAAATGADADNFSFKNYGNRTFSNQQVQDFYAGGGDDNRMAQELGITDPWQRREALLQARQVAGPGTMSGDAGMQRYFEQYKQYNPNGAYTNDYESWLTDQNPHVRDAMLSGTYTGVATAPANWRPGGIYAPGTGHDHSFEQSRYGTGAHGTGDGWSAWTGAAGEGGGVQTSQPMTVNANGALVYSGNGTSTAPTQGQQGWIQPPGNNPTPGALTTTANVVQPGQTAGNAVVPQRPPMSWGNVPPTPAGPQFQTPVLNALYNAQQQRMTTPAPSFNFQATAQEPQGALTQAIQG